MERTVNVTRQQAVEEAGRLLGDLTSHVEDYALYGDDENFTRFCAWFARRLRCLFLQYGCRWDSGLHAASDEAALTPLCILTIL